MALDRWDDIPFEVIEEGRTAQAGRPRWGLIAGIAAVVVLSLSTIAIVALRVTNLLGANEPAHVVQHDGLQERRDESREVFGRFDALDLAERMRTGSDADELQSIQELFDNLQTWAAGNDHAAFRQAVDWDRFVARMEGTRLARQLTAWERRAYRRELQSSIECDVQWTTVEIAGVTTPDGATNTRIVYAFCDPSVGTGETPFRFWLVNDAGAWRIYDWEQLDLGMPDSRYYAIYAKYHATGAMAAYDEWIETLHRADEHLTEDEEDQARAALREAEALSIVPELKDYCWVIQGRRWELVGDSDEAARCFSNVQRPTVTPGGYYNQMTELSWVDPAGALRNADAFEEAVGPSPSLLRIKAQSYEQLGRRDDALAAWKRLLKMRPDDGGALTAWLLALPEDESREFFAHLDRLEDGPSVAARVAAGLAYDHVDRLGTLVAYLQKAAPDAAETFEAMGLAAEADGRFRAAADAYQQAAAAAEDDDARTGYWGDMIRASAEAGRFSAALEACPDDEDLFADISYLIDDWDIEVSRDEYQAFAQFYASRYPQSLEAFANQIWLALSEDNLTDAVRLARAALEIPRSHDEADSEYDPMEGIRSQLATALLRQGRVAEAYAASEDAEESFARLARLAQHRGLWRELDELIALHEKEHADDPQLLAARGEVAMHDGLELPAFNDFRAALERLPEDRKWMVRDRLAAHSCRCGLWEQYYAGAEDQSAAFANLARILIDRRRWNDLEALVALREADDRYDPHLLTVASQVAWQRGEYRTFVRLAEQRLALTGESAVRGYSRQRLDKQRTEALLRVGDVAAARRLTEDRQLTPAEWANRAVVLAVDHQPEAAAAAVRKALDDDDSIDFYWDELAGPLFLAGDFAELQNDVPPQLPPPVVRTVAVAFVGEPVALSAANFAKQLQRLDVEGAPRPVMRQTTEGPVAAGWTIELAGARLWLATGDGPFAEAWDLGNATHAEYEAIRRSPHWLAVGVTAFDSRRRQELAPLARRALTGLVDSQSATIAHFPEESWRGAVLLAPGSESAAAWAAGIDPETAVDEPVETVAHAHSPYLPRDRDFRDAIYAAARRLEAAPDARLTVWTHVAHDAGVDPAAIEVDQVRRSALGWQFVGTLRSESRLVPELALGTKVAVVVDVVDAWQFNDEPVQLRRE